MNNPTMNKPSPRTVKSPPRTITPELIRLALACIPPDVERETWVRVGMAVKAELGAAGFDLWDEWSRQGQSYSSTDAKDTWRSIKAGGKVTVATLFGIAKDHGFRFPEDAQAPAPANPAAEAERQRLAELKRQQQAAEAEQYRRRADEAAERARKLWARASLEGTSPYLVRKGVGAYGVRFLDDGTLVVPMRDTAGELQNVQTIAPAKPTEAEAAQGKREKRFLHGGRKNGLWHLLGSVPAPALGSDGSGTTTTAATGEPAPLVLLLGEGYATCASLHEATGRAVVVAFDGGNLANVARELRALYPAALVLVCGDNDRAAAERTGKNPGLAYATKAAQAAGEPAGVVLPEGMPDGLKDFNDLASHADLQAVAAQVAAAIAAPAIPKAQRARKSAPGAANGPQDGPWHHPDPKTPLDGASGGPATGVHGGAGEDGGGGDGNDDAPELEAGRRPGRDPFHLDEDGVWFTARDADGNKKPPFWLCAPLHITARTRADDTNGWGFLLEFSDLDHNHKVWAMPAAMLSGEGAEWAARLRDMGLQMAPGVKARNLVAQYIDTRNPPERVTCTDRVGWHPGGVYVLPSASVGQAEGGRRYVFQSEAGMEDTFRRAGTLQAWQDGVARLCASNTRLVFAICCAFAGPLLRLAGMESGGFHFRGDSSKGKTTALKIAASVWGRPTYMQRWRTTDNALEATAVQHCDGLLILDEIGQVDGKVVGDCAYLLANEQEKNRNTRGGLNRKRRTWRLLFLSSGEKSLASHMAEAGKRVMAGQEVRMVDIPLDAGMGMGGIEALHDHESPADLVDAITSAGARSYGTAGRAWLEWLAPRFDELGKQLANDLERHKGAIVPESASEQVRRVGSRFALVAAAGELAAAAGILPWPAGQAGRAAAWCFNAWLSARGHLDNGEEVSMLRQVQAFMETNGDALFTWTHRGMDDHRPNTALRVGFKRLVNEAGEPLKVDAAVDYLERKDGFSRDKQDAFVEYLIFPEAFRNKVCQGFDAQAVATLLRKRGHLKCERDRLTNKHRLPGMDKAPVYHLLPSIFAEDN